MERHTGVVVAGSWSVVQEILTEPVWGAEAGAAGRAEVGAAEVGAAGRAEAGAAVRAETGAAGTFVSGPVFFARVSSTMTRERQKTYAWSACSTCRLLWLIGVDG